MRWVYKAIASWPMNSYDSSPLVIVSIFRWFCIRLRYASKTFISWLRKRADDNRVLSPAEGRGVGGFCGGE